MFPCRVLNVFLVLWSPCWIIKDSRFVKSPHLLVPLRKHSVTEDPTDKKFICVYPSVLFLRFLSVFCFLFSVFPMFPMEPLAANFTSLFSPPFPIGVCGWVQPVRRFNGVWRRCAELTVLDRGKLLPPRQPPRHHRTELEGGYHPVSGECLPPIQNTARPSAQPTISPLCGVRARAHHWWRARACRYRRAIAQECSRAEDCHGARASQIVRPGARAGYNDHHKGESHGQWEHGEELRPLHRGWGWANFGSWTV